MTYTNQYHPKFSLIICNTCPHLKFCQDNLHLPLGTDPAARCPDGFAEKTFAWELPGPAYKRPSGIGRYTDKIADGDLATYTSFNRPGKEKWCIMCLLNRVSKRVSPGSRYWLCLQHSSGKFNPWKKRKSSKETLERLKGRIHNGYIYTFKRKRYWGTIDNSP